ncbi:RNA polymerase subunit sigma-24 [Mesorhizobium sp. NBSH29]|nr:RNA polymerase subunit sigma-24 [Mesorhizobium sp. NBSH29]
MDTRDVPRTIDAVWRIEQTRILAGLARMVRDVGLAEEFAQDALIAALKQWPLSGVPANPGAWLTATAKRRAIDHFRRQTMADRKHVQIGHELDSENNSGAAEIEDRLDDDIGDDMLGLMFVASHPMLATEARIALTLKLLGGLTTEEIGRAFLVSETTVAQRIVRAKRALAASGEAFEIPRGEARNTRLSSVMEVLYLIFNEGYSASSGEDWIRPQLCEEAMRLGRVLAGLAPDEPEVHGLVALMELQASRFKARVDGSGDPVRLPDQNRARWDHLLIGRGLAALERSESLAPQRGPYAFQAAIAACHARARVAEDTDWARIAALYHGLAELTPSPVVALNRAVAVSMAYGPEAGLALLDPLLEDPAVGFYHLLPAARGDLLFRLYRFEEAAVEFERAARLSPTARDRIFLERRAETSRSRTVVG